MKKQHGHLWTRLLAVVLTVGMLVASVPAGVLADSARPTDQTSPRSGNIFVEVSGEYDSMDAAEVLAEINLIRYTA